MKPNNKNNQRKNSNEYLSITVNREKMTILTLVTVSFLLFLSIIWYDINILGFPVLAEDTVPNASVPFLFRGLFLLSSASFFFLAILVHQRSSIIKRKRYSSRLDAQFRFISLGVVLVALTLFLADARVFYEIGYEDNIVEKVSALLLFASSAGFLWLFVHLVQIRDYQIRLLVVVLFFSGVFFVIGMEEVSWFQRVFEYETPTALDNVSKWGEASLHSINVALSEIGYYFGSFIFLIVLPFIHDRTNYFDRLGRLEAFIPSPTAMFVAAPAFAFNYVFWNLTFTQFAFWFTLFVLTFFTYQSWRNGKSLSIPKNYILLLLLTFIVAQLIFMVGGNRFVRLWDATEYKELIIPMAFFAFTYTTVVNIAFSEKQLLGRSAPNA